MQSTNLHIGVENSRKKEDGRSKWGMRLKILFFCFISGIMFRFVSDRVDLNLRKKRDVSDESFSPESCPSSLCTSPECVSAAATFLANMNTSADPCVDFFDYACGGWIKDQRHKVMGNRLYYAVNLNVLQEKVNVVIQELLHKVRKVPDEFYSTKPYEAMFTFYDSCMNVEELKTKNSKEKVFRHMEDLKGFQFGKTFDPSLWNITMALLSLMKQNGAPLFDLAMDVDVADTRKWIPVISSPRRYGLLPALMKRDAEDKTPKVDEENPLFVDLDDMDVAMSDWFTELMKTIEIDRKDLFEMLQMTVKSERQQNIITKMIKILTEWSMLESFSDPLKDEIPVEMTSTNSNESDQDNCSGDKSKEISKGLRNLVKLSFKKLIDQFISKVDKLLPSKREQLISMQNNSVLNRYTVQELTQQFPTIEWPFLLGEIFGKDYLKPSTEVIVNYPKYLKGLNTVIQNSSAWLQHWGILSLYFYDVIDELTSSQVLLKREQFCTEAVKNAFSPVVTHFYLHDIGIETVSETQHFLREMILVVKQTLEELLDSAEWLPEEERQFFKLKLDGMSFEIGAAESQWNISNVDTFFDYNQLNMSKEDFLGNVVKIYEQFRSKIYTLFHKPIDKNIAIWEMTVQPYVVNAFNFLGFNSITLPQALLSPPFFVRGAPDYINYGTLATSISHELFHGFDLLGMMFDRNGGLIEDQKTPVFSEKLGSTRDCFHKLLVKNFQKVEMFEGSNILWSIDSNATYNENLADIYGITAAFYSYKFIEKNRNQKQLPGLPLTNDQLFFISAAQPYCAVMPLKAKLFLLELDDHLPNDIRVNAMMMNSPEFRYTFSCPSNPATTIDGHCTIF